jgi:hypothetical protein
MNTVEISKGMSIDVGIDVLKQIFPVKFNKQFNYKESKAPFYRLITPLKEVLIEVINMPVHKDKEYILIFDDLDINFHETNEKSIKYIVELLRVVKDFNNNLLSNSSSRIIVLLRDDIKRSVIRSNTDTAKIFSSYEINLNWYRSNDVINENESALKNFINRRIRYNFTSNELPFNEEDPWQSLFAIDLYGNKTSFKYILDYTFYRPRDLILFFNKIGLDEYSYPLDKKTVNTLIKKMVQDIAQEIKNELAITFTKMEIFSIFDFFRSISNSTNLTYSAINDKIKRIGLGMKAEEVFKLFIEYSYIFVKIDGHVYFSYRGDTYLDTIDLKAANYSIHTCLYAYFHPHRI